MKKTDDETKKIRHREIGDGESDEAKNTTFSI